MAAQPRGNVKIDREECKGCGLCIDACPPKCLEFEAELSAYGVHPARYAGQGCSGCGICFYVCPEPGAITVYRAPPPPKTTGKDGESSQSVSSILDQAAAPSRSSWRAGKETRDASAL